MYLVTLVSQTIISQSNFFKAKELKNKNNNTFLIELIQNTVLPKKSSLWNRGTLKVLNDPKLILNEPK